MNKECECITKWKEEVKREYNATMVSLYNSQNFHQMTYRKMITPPKNWKGEKQPIRESKRWYCADNSKDFKFCPLCGKKLNDAFGVENG